MVPVTTIYFARLVQIDVMQTHCNSEIYQKAYDLASKYVYYEVGQITVQESRIDINLRLRLCE